MRTDDADRARREAEERARREAEAERERQRASLEERIHFDYDRSEIRAQDRSMMEAKADILGRARDITMTITGHADERGSIEYNLALGMRRAQTAREYLTSYGVDGSRIQISSLGEQDPIDTGSSESAYARNRRAEFRVTGGQMAANR